MQVALTGSSASTVTVGILLLTHARRLGERIAVSIVGSPQDVATVAGPAIVYSPVLSGCGVGRVPKSNALVCIGGPAQQPLALSLVSEGITDWFEVDRNGDGLHPSTRAVIGLCRHDSQEGQNLGRELRGALAAFGCPAEPALLDILFGAPIDPLDRISLALLAGRGMTGKSGDPFTRYVESGVSDLPDPLPTPLSEADYSAAVQNGSVENLLARIRPGVRESVTDWLAGMDRVEADPSMGGLVRDVAEVGSYLLSLPMAGMLPTPSTSASAIGKHLGKAIGDTSSPQCAMRSLIETFEFLGGTFVEHSPYALTVPSDPPPEGRKERWEWMCQSAAMAREESERLWARMVDPVQ